MNRIKGHLSVDTNQIRRDLNEWDQKKKFFDKDARPSITVVKVTLIFNEKDLVQKRVRILPFQKTAP